MDLKYINIIKKLEEENKKLLNDIQLLKNKENQKETSPSFKYSEIFNKVPIGILIFTKNLKFIDANETFFKIFDISKNQIQDFNINNITDNRVSPAFYQVQRGHEGFYEGEYITNFTGTKLFASIHTKPSTFEFEGDIIEGGIAVIEDITEHSIAESAVNKSYDTFQRVTDSVNAIIYVIDPKSFKVLFMNNKANEVFGDKIGLLCYQAFFNSDKQCDNCQVNELQKKNAPLGKFWQTDFYEKNTKRWFQISYGYIEWVDNRKVMLLTSIDITVEKISLTKIQEQNRKFEDTLHRLTLQNEQINKQSEELKVSGAIKDTMFSIIAHDLRGPVGNITSALDIVIDEIDEFDKKEIIEIVKPVRDSASSAYNLLVNLLFWAKNESGETFFIREQILLNDIIEDVLTLFKPNFETKNIIFINSIRHEYYVFADEHMIHTVIRNLISNAIKYTNEGGRVEIGLEKSIVCDKDFLEFWVKDNGIGIGDDDISKIMNSKEFFSTYGTNKEKGTGIGIILTKEFVERHNGKIKINSKIGDGTKISILLPIDQK